MKFKQYIFLLICSTSLLAQESSLLDLGFEELMKMRITSFDGTPKEINRTPAAIHVISSEDIRSSSARSVPELLRGAPGLQVSQIDAHTWAISSRGFSRRYSNKLQVLIDGRSIYTPLFSGVHWELSDMPLGEIERIEIIRGPGGPLWGANAVNGVINIITKSANQTAGNYLSFGAGSFHKNFGTYRFGEVLDEKDLAYRVSLSGNQTGHFKGEGSDNKKDDWEQLRLSSRIDWQPDEFNSFNTSFGAFYLNTEKEINVIAPGNIRTQIYDESLHSSGFFWQGSWDRTIDMRNHFFAQLSYDQYDKEDVDREEASKTYSLDVRHAYEYSDKHKFTIGGGYKFYQDNYNNSDFLGFTPDSQTTGLFTLFIQDEITLFPEELFLILGTKYEYNDHTKSEFQPSVKLSWIPSEIHSFWASVGRAVRTPNRADEDIRNRLFFAGPTEVNLEGTRKIRSEELIAYEAGYRYGPSDSPWTFDLSLFYHDYDRLNDFESAGSSFVINNEAEGYSYGAEVFVNYELMEDWNLKGSYSVLEDRLEGGEVFAGGNVANMASLQSEVNLTQELTFYQNLYYTDHYSSARYSYNDSYKLDVGLRWAITDKFTMTAWGLNLLDPSTLEYADDETGPAELPRSFYVQLEWEF
ncbi:MAG: TonB-dependent receptor [Lentisphaeraceae bacterium]|nr:TonB-dependent receptor [Lentisphaeraceae bacterium]